MGKILYTIIGISFAITLLDTVVSLSSNRDPFIWRLTYDFILIIVAFFVSIILLLQNVVYQRWGEIFPDLGLFFQAFFVFLTRFPENFVDVFISFLQFPFWLLASLLEVINPGSSYLRIDIPIIHAYISLDVATIEITFFVEILGQYVWFVINFFGSSEVQGVTIEQFGIAVIHYMKVLDQPVQNNFVLSIKESLIDPIVEAFKFGMGDLDLEEIVNRILEQF